MTLVPRPAMELSTAARAPWPTASMAITAATPMMMPSMVRKVRRRLRERERRAMRKRAESCKSGPSLGWGKLIQGFAGRARLRIGLVKDDMSVPHDHLATGEFGDIGFMGHQHHGDALGIEPLEKVHDFDAG